jgi:hypothetical protein
LLAGLVKRPPTIPGWLEQPTTAANARFFLCPQSALVVPQKGAGIRTSKRGFSPEFGKNTAVGLWRLFYAVRGCAAEGKASSRNELIRTFGVVVGKWLYDFAH